MNRLRLVQLSVNLLHQWLSEGTPGFEIASNPLPGDAVLVAVHSDGRTVTLTYHSDAFSSLAEGEYPPLHEIMLRDPRAK